MANEKKMDYVLLGLLSHEAMTGYEIKKRLDNRLRLFWNASYGSIYPTLNQLEEEGCVTKTASLENGRDKNIYAITERGKERLRQWLKKPVVKDEFRCETLLKLFFGNDIGETITIEHIQRFKENVEKELPYLRETVQKLKQHDSEEEHKYYMLTALFGVRVYETYLEWCKETADILKGEEKNE